MKHRPDIPLRRAGLVVLVCLALPFLCFTLWDAILIQTAPFAPQTGEALSAVGRENPTACLLYGCAHSLNVSLQGGTEGWTLDETTPRDEQAADLQALLDPLQQAGIVSTAQRTFLTLALENSVYYALTHYTLAAGLEQYCLLNQSIPGSDGPPSGYPHFSFCAIFTPEGVPVYLKFLGGPFSESPALTQVLEFSGLMGFSDWTPQLLAGYAGEHGEALYSESAQLYAQISYEQGFIYRLVSMAPSDMQTFLQEDSPS